MKRRAVPLKLPEEAGYIVKVEYYWRPFWLFGLVEVTDYAGCVSKKNPDILHKTPESVAQYCIWTDQGMATRAATVFNAQAAREAIVNKFLK